MSYPVRKSSAEAPRILVIDDEHEITNMIDILLREEGFEPITFTRGLDALDYVKDQKVDLVLLDIVMPEVDGFSVAKRIKETIGADFVPIIMISALREEEHKIAGLAFADDYVTKPFSYEELLARIRAMLRIRQLQVELLESRGRYQRLYDAMPEMCVSLDCKRVILDCNMSFSRTFGLSKNQIAGKDIISFFDASDQRRAIDFFGSLGGEQSSPDAPLFKMAKRRGENEPMIAAIRAVQTGVSDDDAMIVLTMQDETRRVKLERDQQIARRQLYRSARLASIGTLASGVAHELNNPLAAILGFSDALVHRLENQETVDLSELEQYLQIINAETIRCRNIVENLSKFARDSESRLTAISLGECITSALTLISSRAQKQNVSLANEVQDNVMINGDLQKITQVLVNVLTNAIDFSPAGSTITISSDPWARNEHSYRLRIADNGPGIAPEHVSQVFDPFFTTKEVGQGVGLGLAICYRIMEECEGNIDIVSKREEGTTVILDLQKALPV
jgi:PAS domain S-box-containing protein